MATALQEQLQSSEVQGLSFDERLGLLVDRELTERENRRLQSLLRKAHLRQSASVEDVNYRHPRNLDRSLFSSLTSCRWVQTRHNVLITGKTGLGKTYLACALAQKACREGYSAQYLRLPRLLPDLALARADGRYGKLLGSLAKVDVLVLDDWGLAPMSDAHRRDLLEIVEDRHGLRSTVITSQIPVDHWHETIGDPTLADAILDRLVHNAYAINLDGETMRKQPSSGLTHSGHPE